jgi:hypothetical protein
MRNLTGYSIWLMRAAAIVAVVFGAATIRAGGSVLFGDGAQAAGNVVGFVLWFNFLAGVAYVVAGAGLWLRTRWSAGLALAFAATTVLVFVGFGIHVVAGGAFEARTAVLFRRGDSALGFHIIVFGQAKLAFTSLRGDEKVVDLMDPGQSFGEAVMFMVQNRTRSGRWRTLRYSSRFC